MSFRLPLIRKSFRYKREPVEDLENIEENNVYRCKIESMTDGNCQRQCRQSLRIKEGANRIYNLSKNFFQKMDAAKAILVSGQKIEMVTSQYENNSEGCSNIVYKSKGQITLSDIKVPLLWRSINGQLFANGTYSLFCIIKAGSEVLETQLICDIGDSMCDVVFSDVIQINDVDYDSKCTVELYGYAVNNSSIALVRRNSKRRSSYNEVPITDTKRNKKFPFQSLGYITLDLNDSSQNESSCNLIDFIYNSDCDIPLFGTISYKFLIIPMSKIRCVFAGQADIQFLSDNYSKESLWNTYHCEIKDRTLHCWKFVNYIEELVNKMGKPLSERDDVETADQIIPIIKQTNISMILQDSGDFYLKMGTYFDEKINDYQEMHFKSNQLETLYESIRNHIDELDIWNGAFDFDEMVAKPTSFLRHGSVFRNSVYMK